MMKGNELSESVFPRRVIHYATIFERSGAFVIDLFIILFVSIIINTWLPVPYCWIFAAWVYEATQVSGAWQATIGQRVMGIKVSNTQGGALGFIEASVRHFSKYISLLTALSGYLVIILDKRRQCLHDKIAESFVVTEESYQAAI